MSAYFRGDFQHANQFFNNCDSLKTEPRVFYFRGLSALQMGNYAAADVDFQRAAEIEIQRIDLDNLARDDSVLLEDVGRSLERIQGPARERLERYRSRARAFNRDAQLYKIKRTAEIRAKVEHEAETRRIADANRPKSLNDLVGEVIQLDGKLMRVLDVEISHNGIRSITAIDPTQSLDSAKFSRTFINTGREIVTGAAAVEYVISRNSHTYSAAELQRFVWDKFPTPLVFNPLYAILSDPASAAEGWQKYREQQEEKRRQEELLAQRRAEQEALQKRLEWERELERRAERLARAEESQREEEQRERARDKFVGGLFKLGIICLYHSAAVEADEHEGRIARSVSKGGRMLRDSNLQELIQTTFPNLDRDSVRTAQCCLGTCALGNRDC